MPRILATNMNSELWEKGHRHLVHLAAGAEELVGGEGDEASLASLAQAELSGLLSRLLLPREQLKKLLAKRDLGAAGAWVPEAFLVRLNMAAASGRYVGGELVSTSGDVVQVRMRMH